MTRPHTDDPLELAADWHTSGHGVALATVISTWGSAPRPAGSQLVARDDGAFAGSVSGGCVEGAVVEAAVAVIADGNPRALEFGVAHEDAWAVGLACGGRIRVLVEAVRDTDVIDAIRAARKERRAVVVATELASGRRAVLAVDALAGDPARLAGALDANTCAAVAADAVIAARRDQSRVVAGPEGEVFLGVVNPPLGLVVVGAVHIAQSLCPIASALGFAVTVVDPRGAFATPARFPDVELVCDWPDDALPALTLDARTAVVTLTHDPKIDEPALRVALASEAFYVGALGSRKTQAARLARLRAAGLDEPTLARIHGPVGLDIGARSAAEIAVSIAAEMTSALRAAP